MPKLVRNKPPAPLAEGDGWEADSTEQPSVKPRKEPNSVRRGLEADRILFDESTEPTEQPSVEMDLPKGKPLKVVYDSAVPKAQVILTEQPSVQVGPDFRKIGHRNQEPTEQDSVDLEAKPNAVRSDPETDRTEFGASTDSTEQASVTLPRGTKAVLKAPVNEAERRPFDDYPTEPGWTQALLDREKFNGRILEPAAGAGWMVQTLQENGLEVQYSDLERDGVDFLEYQGPGVENVITNPPYKFLDAFAAKALEVATHKVALLLPDFALVGVNRTRDLWQAHPPKKLILVTSKMKVLGKVSMFPHVWAVWDKWYEGPTEWEWATVPKEQRLDTNKAVPNLKESAK